MFGSKENCGDMKTISTMRDGGAVAAGANNAEVEDVGDTQAWIVKCDSTGSKEWSRKFDVDDIVSISESIPLANSGVLLLGNLRRPSAPPPVVLRLNKRGKTVWRETPYEKEGDSGGIGLLERPSLTLVDEPGDPRFIWQIAGSGENVWTQLDESIGEEVTISEGVPDQNGGAYLVGGVDKDPGSSIGYLVKINANGTKLWDRTFEVGDSVIKFQTIHKTKDAIILSGTAQHRENSYSVLIVEASLNGEIKEEYIIGDNINGYLPHMDGYSNEIYLAGTYRGKGWCMKRKQ